jgi:nitroimidazol reductase NimA-like FMN-containing flavoprotein (pyridoxamine 5'-phosphate oxidase superfamily)
MNGVPLELSAEECLERLRAGSFGRIAFVTPGGVRIVPVNYSVVDKRIVVRTSPYSELGSYATDSPAAFEMDRIDEGTRSGWSVVVTGRLRRVTDGVEIERIRRDADPEPWAAGSRALYLLLDWRDLSGRRLEGADRRDAGLRTRTHA